MFETNPSVINSISDRTLLDVWQFTIEAKPVVTKYHMIVQGCMILFVIFSNITEPFITWVEKVLNKKDLQFFSENLKLPRFSINCFLWEKSVIGITQPPPKEGARVALFVNLSKSALDNYVVK